MRLINEDDVLEIVERVTNEAVEGRQPKYLIQPKIVCEIAGLPTIEAEPVKHGRWEHHAGMNSKCTCCGNYFPVAEFERRPFDVNFCIWCGARMDGDSDDDR